MSETTDADRRYASRKFILAAAVWVVGTIGWLTTALGWWTFTTDQWITFSQWILGLYMAGNVGDSFATFTKR